MDKSASLKTRIVQHLRGGRYQTFWERLQRLAQVGMNHWGGAHYGHSGEAQVLKHIAANGDPGFGKLVLDVGANQGYYAEMALSILPMDHRIICFEPSRSTRSILEEKLAAPIAAGRVSVVPMALGSEAGTMVLHLDQEGTSVASVYAFDPHTRPWEDHLTETIELTTLDDHMAKSGIDRVLFIKIDVEGHEFAVLQGASQAIARRAIQFIQFEFGEAHIDARTFFLDMYKALEANYTLHRILPEGLRRIDHYTPDLEVFRTTNYLAVLK